MIRPKERRKHCLHGYCLPHPMPSTFETKNKKPKSPYLTHPPRMVWQKDRTTDSKKVCLGKPLERAGSYRLNTEGQQPSLPTAPTGLTVREVSGTEGCCNLQKPSPPPTEQEKTKVWVFYSVDT